MNDALFILIAFLAISVLVLVIGIPYSVWRRVKTRDRAKCREPGQSAALTEVTAEDVQSVGMKASPMPVTTGEDEYLARARRREFLVEEYSSCTTTTGFWNIAHSALSHAFMLSIGLYVLLVILKSSEVVDSVDLMNRGPGPLMIPFSWWAFLLFEKIEFRMRVDRAIRDGPGRKGVLVDELMRLEHQPGDFSTYYVTMQKLQGPPNLGWFAWLIFINILWPALELYFGYTWCFTKPFVGTYYVVKVVWLLGALGFAAVYLAFLLSERKSN